MVHLLKSDWLTTFQPPRSYQDLREVKAAGPNEEESSPERDHRTQDSGQCLVEGMSLYSYLKQYNNSTAGKFLTELDCKPILRQVASGLSYLHKVNLSHRDVKLDLFKSGDQAKDLLWNTQLHGS